MRLTVLQSINDVVERQLCSGCGACAAVSPQRYEMIDTRDHGRRPRVRDGASPGPGDDEALSVCPGVAVEHDFDETQPGLIRSLRPGWGPVLEVWEGHASDGDLRFKASSGGAASAIALACLETGGFHGVLHIKARDDVPYLNHTVLSTTRDEILAATGSRYAPASPCDGLRLIEDAPGPCVLIAKPCDVAAARRVQAIRPRLRERLGVTIAFFCAGTPTTAGTLQMLRRMGVDDPTRVTDLRYRGHGWPGDAVATVQGPAGPQTRRLAYEESWGEILTNHKQWRCHVCADHTGERADIAVGDPWHRTIEPGERGESLVLVRTERGRRVLREAMEAGYLSLRRADPSILPASQPSLLRGRGAVWGRLLACRLLGAAVPRYRGFPLFRFWWSTLTASQKLRTIAGTARRVLSGRLHRREPLEPIGFDSSPARREHAVPARGRRHTPPETRGFTTWPMTSREAAITARDT